MNYGGYEVVFLKPGEEMSPKMKRKMKKRMEKEIHKAIKELCKREEFWIEKRKKEGENFLYRDKEQMSIAWKINVPQIGVPIKIVLVENDKVKEIQ